MQAVRKIEALYGPFSDEERLFIHHGDMVSKLIEIAGTC